MARPPHVGRARRSVRSPGDLVEIAVLTLALSAAGVALPAGAAADSGPSSGSSGPPAGETSNSGNGGGRNGGNSGNSGSGGEGQAAPAQGQAPPQAAPAAQPQQPAPAEQAAPAQHAAPAQQAAPAKPAAPAQQAAAPKAHGQGHADSHGSGRGSGNSQARPPAQSEQSQAPRRQGGGGGESQRHGDGQRTEAPRHRDGGGSTRHGDRPSAETPRNGDRPSVETPRNGDRPGAETPRNGDRSGGTSPDNSGRGSHRDRSTGAERRHGGSGHGKQHGTPGRPDPGEGGTERPKPQPDHRPAPSVPGHQPPISPSASPPVRPMVVSEGTLSRLTPTAAATAPPRRNGRTTEQARIGAAHHRPGPAAPPVARAAMSGGYAWGRRALAHLAHTGRGTADVERVAGVGSRSPVRDASLPVVAPLQTRPTADRRLAAPQQDPAPAVRRTTIATRAGELAARAGHAVRDALVYALLVGLAFSLAAYALMRARLRLIAGREATMGPVEFSTAALGTALSRVEVAQFIGAANAEAALQARERSSADGRSMRPPVARPADVAPSASASTVAAEARPARRPRHRPWHTEEIAAGLGVGCRLAEERNAVLSQRLLRALAQEDPRIPSWSVVDRAARKAGETGGAWLREARRLHRHGSGLHAMPGPYGEEAAA
jgi:hypothetical protein